MGNSSAAVGKMKVGIETGGRAAIAGALSRVLAGTFTLCLTALTFYSNVTGPMFTALHATFKDQYTELWGALDPIAIRIRALGEWAPGSYADFRSLASMDDAPRVPLKAAKMVQVLLMGREANGKNLSHGISCGGKRQRSANDASADEAHTSA